MSGGFAFISPGTDDGTHDGGMTTFPTLADLMSALAEQLGGYVLSGVSTTVPSGEPGRWVILDAFKDDEDPRSQFADGTSGPSYLYVRQGSMAGEQRRVRTEGYEGPFGALALSRVLDVNGTPTNPPPGTLVEVTEPLPMRPLGLTRGVFDLVNDALDRIWIQARLRTAGNGTRSYPLDGFEWLTEQAQTDGLYDWRYVHSGGPSRRTTAEYAIVKDGPTVTLATASTYGTSEEFELAVLVQASRLVFDGAAWGYAQHGLVHDTDQAAVLTSWVVTIGMALGLDYLLARNEQDRMVTEAERARKRGDYSRRLETRWGPAAASLIKRRLPRRDIDPPRRLVGVSGRLERTRHWHH